MSPRHGSGTRPATRSLSFRLAVSYAGIAALTSLVKGGLLLVILTLHFDRVHKSYLNGVAMRTRDNLTSSPPSPSKTRHRP